jgi:hypothetical protein
LRPYITDIKFEFDNYKEEIASKIISCSPINNFTYQNEVMNYSFILPEKKELSDLKIKITGKDPINPIESNVNFDNILKLEDGEEMSKMIVGKALKNNEELTKDEEKEIKFAKKYQILSKNTSLFAEVINEDNQQSKLVKVELNKTKEKKDDYYDHPYLLNMINNLRMMNKMSSNVESRISPISDKVCLANRDICYAAAPMKAKKSSIFGFTKSKKSSDSNFLGGLKNKFKGLFSKKDATSKTAIENDYSSFNSKKESEGVDLCYAMPERDFSPEKKYSDDEDEDEIEPPKINIINNNSISKSNINNNKNDYDTNLIISQDIIEGSWDENNETKKLIDIISSDTFNKIKNKITALSKGANENKIIYTILVIYYLKTKLTSKLSEYRLVINKAEKFLTKNGINYDDIVFGV